MKYNIKTFGASALIGILLGVVIALLLDFVPKVYEEVITRGIIEDSDNLLKLLDKQKYIEASYLSKSISTQWWFLRNAYDTKFYDSVSDQREYTFWSIASSLRYSVFINCTEQMGGYCQTSIEQMKSDIKFHQEQICPKSDLYNSKYVKKYYADFPEQMEEMLNITRC